MSHLNQSTLFFFNYNFDVSIVNDASHHLCTLREILPEDIKNALWSTEDDGTSEHVLPDMILTEQVWLAIRHFLTPILPQICQSMQYESNKHCILQSLVKIKDSVAAIDVRISSLATVVDSETILFNIVNEMDTFLKKMSVTHQPARRTVLHNNRQLMDENRPTLGAGKRTWHETRFSPTSKFTSPPSIEYHSPDSSSSVSFFAPSPKIRRRSLTDQNDRKDTHLKGNVHEM